MGRFVIGEETEPAAHGLVSRTTNFSTAFKRRFREDVVTEAILDIRRWGNNLGVRLPAAIAREAHLRADSGFALPWRRVAW